MLNTAKTINEALSKNFMKELLKAENKTGYRYVKDEKYRFVLTKENENPIILAYDSSNNLKLKILDNDFPKVD